MGIFNDTSGNTIDKIITGSRASQVSEKAE
jgi:hypothetical protein